MIVLDQAVYTVLREAEDRSISPIPTWEIPIWKDISPRQKKVNGALKLINTTLDDLIAICKVKLLYYLSFSVNGLGSKRVEYWNRMCGVLSFPANRSLFFVFSDS